MKILIHPYSNNYDNKNAKNYPFWNELIYNLSKEHEINQIGIEEPLKNITHFYKNISFKNIKKVIEENDLWISIDSFLPHYCKCYNLKSGIVLWGTSDPNIFGYKENRNLLKHRKYLRKNQFLTWHNEKENPDAFVDYEIVMNEVNNGCRNN